MRTLMLVTAAAVLMAAPMTVTVKADEVITIQENQKKDKDKDTVIIKEREKTNGLSIRRDDDVVIKERQPRKKEDEKVIIREK
jgi:hypothetical protein